MSLPHKLEGRYEHVAGDTTYLYEASVERLEYSNGTLTGFFTAGVSVFPTLDQNLTGISKIIAKLKNEFKSNHHFVGNVSETEPSILVEEDSESIHYLRVAYEAALKLEEKGVDFIPYMLDLAFLPIGERLEELLDSVEK